MIFNTIEIQREKKTCFNALMHEEGETCLYNLQ